MIMFWLFAFALGNYPSVFTPNPHRRVVGPVIKCMCRGAQPTRPLP